MWRKRRGANSQGPSRSSPGLQPGAVASRRLALPKLLAEGAGIEPARPRGLASLARRCRRQPSACPSVVDAAGVAPARGHHPADLQSAPALHGTTHPDWYPGRDSNSRPPASEAGASARLGYPGVCSLVLLPSTRGLSPERRRPRGRWPAGASSVLSLLLLSSRARLPHDRQAAQRGKVRVALSHHVRSDTEGNQEVPPNQFIRARSRSTLTAERR